MTRGESSGSHSAALVLASAIRLPMLACLLVACASMPAGNRDGRLPDLSDLEAGWNTLNPGGRTSCANGSDYSFFVRPADTLRVLLVLHGGGACWTGVDCDRAEVYSPAIDAAFDPRTMNGVFDLDNTENPFASYTMVVVPNCTGDLLLGDRDTTYTVTAADSTTRRVAVRHRGMVNGLTVLAWIGDQLRATSQIFVIGTSANGMAAPFYASLLAQRQPGARVVALGDGAGIYAFGPGADIDMRSWGLPVALRRHAGWETVPMQWTGADVHAVAARAAPGVSFAQIDHAWDQTQGAWVIWLGGSAASLPSELQSNRAAIARRVDGFQSFTLGGIFHTVTDNDAFYSHSAGGRRIRDWVAALATGDTTGSVACTSCWRPELRYAPADLAFLDAAITLVLQPDAWSARDDTSCAEQTSSYSLRCALQRAARDNPPSDAGFQEVFYTAAERLMQRVPHAEPGRPYNPVRNFNERRGTTAADVIQLLRDVRTRIATALEAR